MKRKDYSFTLLAKIFNKHYVTDLEHLYIHCDGQKVEMVWSITGLGWTPHWESHSTHISVKN